MYTRVHLLQKKKLVTTYLHQCSQKICNQLFGGNLRFKISNSGNNYVVQYLRTDTQINDTVIYVQILVKTEQDLFTARF